MLFKISLQPLFNEMTRSPEWLAHQNEMRMKMTQAVAFETGTLRAPAVESAFGKTLGAAIIAFVNRRAEHAAIKAFQQMGERQLEDLGVTRGDVDVWQKTGIRPKALR